MLYFLFLILICVLIFIVILSYQDKYLDWFINKYSLILDKSIRKSVLDKLEKYCMQLIEQENIKFIKYDTIWELNNICEDIATVEQKNKLAGGLYCYIPKHKISGITGKLLLELQENYPQIKVYSNPCIFTIAHELGHHFCIKNFNDTSELAADNYIFEIVKQCLTPKEIYCISIELECHAKISKDHLNMEYKYESLFPYKEYKNKKILDFI